MRRMCFLLAAVLLFISGCTIGNQTNRESVKLYYALKGNTGLDYENREIEYMNKESKYVKTLEELLKGPSDSSRFETSIDTGTKVLEAVVQDGSLTINFSEEFNVFSGSMHEAVVVASVVDTMLQFAELNKVRILVQGQELIAPSGEPYGFMDFIDFNTGDMTEKEITLYFSDSQAMYMVPEKRIILVNQDISDIELYRTVLEELIKGPSVENLYRTIPEEVRIEYLEMDGDILKVDFSEEMHTKHWHGAAGEAMTINSLANTMTEFENIRGVMPTVDGGPLSIEHMIVEEPLTRNENIIYRQ